MFVMTHPFLANIMTGARCCGHPEVPVWAPGIPLAGCGMSGFAGRDPPATVLAMESRTILLLHPMTGVLIALYRALEADGVRALPARSAAAAFKLLGREPVDAVLCGQELGGVRGTDFLLRVRDRYPDVARLLFAGRADIETMAAAINHGAICKLLVQPWDDRELRAQLAAALKDRDQTAAQRRLAERLSAALLNIAAANAVIETPHGEATQSTLHLRAALERASHALEGAWRAVTPEHIGG